MSHEHGRSNKSLGTSDYYRREAIVRVFESLLSKSYSLLTIQD